MLADPVKLTNTLWYKDAVFYEVFVRAFSDSNGDGIGDLAGLTSKLEYLQWLGIDTIWMLPIFPSPLRDDGYDVADFFNVHPDYGNMDDLKNLIAEAHRRNLKVVVELIPNHTSDQSAWFQASRDPGHPEHAQYRDWYVWNDTDQKYKDARIIFIDYEPSNWAFAPLRRQYYWHRFFSHQPDLNYDNPEVARAMLKVVEFWMDLGVDGFRVDATPYLFEREATNCENLPETHTYLKRLRSFVEGYGPDTMLLSEANQWPEDVRPYFGGDPADPRVPGDEFHMNFRFPLMPRIYLALARKERGPIQQILERTPPIPLDCQWAAFLRNHDELTLEMVTPEEREEMWSVYAPEPRMRLNLGIRRRLAPLLGNDRQRIELANSILFSLPGSPVIYYGDEIGMGDNVFLDDRRGLRTPMQWQDTRSAGFSDADPSQLYSPLIADETYGYHRVNVSDERADPDSLLNRMRTMLAVRKAHRAFGRGDFTMLFPENTAILACLRSYLGITLLSVNNLSTEAQDCELDVTQFAGATPIDLFTGERLTAVTEAPWSLSLPASGYRWMRLATDVES
jgi:maltose alpha-D-glucosyltransferase / alpha-amylase